ncbi:hypothetical protein M3J09_012713 [Ascochyta lentis]
MAATWDCKAKAHDELFTKGYSTHKKLRPSRLCDAGLRYPATSSPPTRRLCVGHHLSNHLTGQANDVQQNRRAPGKLAAPCDQSGFL